MTFSFSACSKVGKTDNVEISIGKSDKFTEDEINNAANCVKESFKSYKGCTLTKLWYDEEKSNQEIESYMKYGRGSINGVKPENVIIFLSNFDEDSSGGDGVLNPNSTYGDYNWLLIMDSETGNRKVDDRWY